MEDGTKCPHKQTGKITRKSLKNSLKAILMSLMIFATPISISSGVSNEVLTIIEPVETHEQLKICELENTINLLLASPTIVKEGVNLVGLHPSLIKAHAFLARFDHMVTSGDDSRHAKHSKHYNGEALDYRFRPWCGTGIELAEYLNSDEGQTYLKENNLRAVLEIRSRRHYKKIKNKYNNIIKHIPRINADHIHLELI